MKRVPTSGWVMWTYDGQMSADFWPETKCCRHLAVVGESGRRKGESTYMKCTYDGQISADFWPETKSCPRLTVVGQKGRLESGRRIGESTYHDVDLRWPDISRFLTRYKKLPMSGHGWSEEEKKRWVHLPWRGPTTARRHPIFDRRKKVADVWPWSVRRGEEKVSPPTMTWT